MRKERTHPLLAELLLEDAFGVRDDRACTGPKVEAPRVAPRLRAAGPLGFLRNPGERAAASEPSYWAARRPEPTRLVLLALACRVLVPLSPHYNHRHRNMLLPLRHLTLAAGPFLLQSAIPAQSLLHTFVGSSPGDMLHYARGAGDVNGDGHADLAVSAPTASVNGPQSGSAFVYSGRDGSVLYALHGAQAGDQLGGLSAAGDIDGDGFGDFFLVPRSDNQGRRIAQVRAGADGSVLHEVHATGIDVGFGQSMGAAGDVNADGVSDFFISSTLEDLNGPDSGTLRVHSGVDAAVLHEFYGAAGDQLGFGFGADGGADVDLDGHADIVVAGRWNDTAGFNAGMVWVYSGANGSVLHAFPGDHPWHEFGGTARFAGDVDGDGHPDILTGTQFDNTNGPGAGMLRVYSGATGMVLYSRYGDASGDRLGDGDGLGDVDGDGFDDFFGGLWEHSGNGFQAGAARVYSGVDGRTLYTLYGLEAGDHFCQGFRVGDVDGDGAPDLMVDSRYSSQNGSHAGAAWVFSLAAAPDCDGDVRSDPLEIEFYGDSTDLNGNLVPDDCELIGVSYCAPNTANSTGLPGTVKAIGSVLPGTHELYLVAESLPPFQFGYFLTSRQQGLVLFPGGSQGALCLGGSIGRFLAQVQNSGPLGRVAIDVDLMHMPVSPNIAVQAGDTWHFQFWHRDVVGMPTSNFTGAMSVSFD